jgi:hypothetical protein
VKEKYPNTLYLYPWDYHLSPRGHASIAEYLAVELEKQSPELNLKNYLPGN